MEHELVSVKSNVTDFWCPLDAELPRSGLDVYIVQLELQISLPLPASM